MVPSTLVISVTPIFVARGTLIVLLPLLTCAALSPNPVTTTVTRNSSVMFGSITVPTTTVASSDVNDLTTSPTSSNSPIDISGPAVILTNTPLAPLKSTSSKSGLEIAAWAALRARPSPRAFAVPIIAMPISDITVRTSAKSTLINPGLVINSAIPWTAPNKTLLAALNACNKLIFLPKTGSNLLLGIVINESTLAVNFLIPSSAINILLRPSTIKGFVTTATVKIPNSLAISAKIGVDPVPVPPPIPAVKKTMSVHAKISRIISRFSSAALRPMSGLAPAPRPLVSSSPNCNNTLARELRKACKSVLAQTNSTPPTFSPIMCSIALPPPPPTPMTLITALVSLFSGSSNIFTSKFYSSLFLTSSGIFFNLVYMVSQHSGTYPLHKMNLGAKPSSERPEFTF